MKKLFTILSVLLIPFMAFGDVLPEPDIFYTDTDQDENILDIDENTLDIVDTTTQEGDVVNQYTNEITIDNSWKVTNSENINTSKWTNLEGLAAIDFWFCNEWTDNLSSNLNYAVNVWQPFKVCALFHNKSNKDITIHIDIVDWATSAQWSKTCSFSSTNIQNFINKDDLASLENLVLPAWDFVIKEFEITFPVWLEWTQSACYTYYIPNGSQEAMISTIITNGSFMDFFVWSLGDIKNEIIASDIKTYMNENNELNLDFLLSNVWNLENKMSIKWEVSNIFWFKREFDFDWKVVQLNAWASTPISIKLWSLPNYGWLFNIKINVIATPFFSYDISQSNIDPSLLEDRVFTITTSYFQMPWLIFALVVMFILILILLFRKPKNRQQN